jgi:hypothetical protein
MAGGQVHRHETLTEGAGLPVSVAAAPAPVDGTEPIL